MAPPLDPPTAPPTTVAPATPSVHAAARSVQRTFDELGRPLHSLTFCVVDLETTGGSAAQGARITEIGAVKVCGGEVLGEFQTLVDPGLTIPPFIVSLTGITDAMVTTAPRIDVVLPMFLEFAQGTVLVAHNAPFDVGFLKHNAAELGHRWPPFEIIDTARIARHVVTRDDAPNCKLASLAVLFSATTTPDHRALSDARATVDVLHGLFERLGAVGVQTIEELQEFTSRVSTAQRRKRHLAEHLPHAPGVYLFCDSRDEVLYVGTSRDLRARVRSYFTASETRSRIGEMVGLAARVEGIECTTALEAEVRELRLIAAHQPPYNRRSRFPDRVHWLKLTKEPWPRLSAVRRVLDDGADYLGPFSSRRRLDEVAVALHEVFPIRECTDRLPATPSGTPCALAALGRCLSPCDGTVSRDDYDETVHKVRDVLHHDARPAVAALTARMADLAQQERFEAAATQRDRLASLVRALARTQRLRGLTRCPEVVAARRDVDHRWSVHVIRYGRLAAAGTVSDPAAVTSYAETLRALAEHVPGGPGPTPAATAAETERILHWLERPGVRLLRIDGEWSSPTFGAGRHHLLHDTITESRLATVPFDERRTVPLVHRP